ncbi:uncharacterized protein LOC124406912 isoform X2 [Diprion similis]|uniref:uncharacterized protein LOC124406912 isoform X2 n=1 Tax=Diprion similis TaxID=362088 RepID=UPI001EF78E9C|nr:uncharacterized protein LOC124406912 isoform X2 [Diprion similis]
MLCKNFLHGMTGHVAEIPSPNKAIIHFELDGVLQSALLKNHRFYKDRKCLSDNENLNKYIQISDKVKFSCHIIDNAEPGQCKWFITNCWRHVENRENTATLSTGIMNVAGTVTDLKQRHGMLVMTDLLENEYRVHFLASKVYIYGKRLPASKPLSSHLHIEDKVYFDAIPCFPEENNQRCNWFATCVVIGKKPEDLYKDLNRIETTETDKDGLGRDVNNSFLSNQVSPSYCQQPELAPPKNASTMYTCEPVKQTHGAKVDNNLPDIFGLAEMESFKEDGNPKVEHDLKLSAKMLHDIKLVIESDSSLLVRRSNSFASGSPRRYPLQTLQKKETRKKRITKCR